MNCLNITQFFFHEQFKKKKFENKNDHKIIKLWPSMCLEFQKSLILANFQDWNLKSWIQFQSQRKYSKGEGFMALKFFKGEDLLHNETSYLVISNMENFRTLKASNLTKGTIWKIPRTKDFIQIIVHTLKGPYHWKLAVSTGCFK